MPRTRFVPGSAESGPRPDEGAALSPSVDDPARWGESLDYLYGVDLLNAGFCWEAHEALEFWWKGLGRAGHGREAMVVRGLIQVAAARIKREVGDETGVRRLLERAGENFRGCAPGDVVMGLDAGAWWTAARAGLLAGEGAPVPVVLTGLRGSRGFRRG